MSRMIQMEFDFRDPKGPEPVETLKVEITRGWDGRETEIESVFTGTRTEAYAKIAAYGRTYGPVREVWSYHDRVTHEVVDFGNHFYFGRLTRV